jgi:hypothetical protein
LCYFGLTYNKIIYWSYAYMHHYDYIIYIDRQYIILLIPNNPFELDKNSTNSI